MRRWVRRIGLGLLVLLGVLLLLVGAALALLNLPVGERFVRNQLVTLANDALPGTLEVGDLDLRATTVVVEDAVLRDPEGNLVARLKRVEATVALMPLLHREIDLSGVRIVRPEVFLVSDSRGLNLLRAVTTPKPDEPPKTPGTLIVRVRDVVLEDGELDVVQTTVEGLAEHFHVRGLGTKGALLFRNPEGALEANAALEGTLTDPVEGPLSLAATFESGDGAMTAEALLALAGLELKADGAWSAGAGASLNLERLFVPTGPTRKLLPSWPLIADLSAHGKAREERGIVQLALKAGAAEAEVSVDGAVDLNRLWANDLAVTAHRLDFSKLVENGPVSNVEAHLKASGGGRSLETLRAQVELRVPKATLDGQTFGPIELHGSADEGRFELAQLELKVPGAQVSAKGEGTLEKIRLSGVLRATDLSRTGNTVARIAVPKGLPIAGNGTVKFVVEGPPQHPGVRLDGGFGSLRYADISVRTLKLEGFLPDIRRPLDADANLSAGVLNVGERNFRDLRSHLVTRGRDLEAEISASGLADLLLRVGGTVDEDRGGIALRALELRYPEAAWTLESPTHVKFSNGDFVAKKLALRSGSQRLVVSGGIRSGRLDTRASVEGLELAKLPSLFVPPELALAGTVNAEVEAKGRTSQPVVDANVVLRGGRFKQYEGLELELKGGYANDRVKGQLDGRAFTSSVSGSFDAPVSKLLKGSREALALDLTIGETDLGTLFAALGIDPGLTGRAAATIKASGTAADPRIRIVVDGDEVKKAEGPPGDVDVIVESDSNGKLVARIDLDTMGGQSYLLLKTPFTAGQFLTGPLNGRMFLETPADLEGSFRDLPLEALVAWGVVETDLRGNVSLTVDAHGTVRAPKGKVHLALKNAAAAGMQPVDLFGTATAADEHLEMTLTALRRQERVMDLSAKVQTAVADLMKGVALEDVPLFVDGEIGPLKVSELQSLAGMPVAEDPDSRPDGIVRATLDITGTMADPKGRLLLTADKLGVGKLALGAVKLDYGYDQALSQAKMVLTNADGGALELKAKTQLDLSLPGLRRGLAWKKAPLEARLTSSEFDPSFLSSVTALVRDIGGELNADATVTGALGAPKLDGKLEWQVGRLALQGYGSYNDIHLLLRGTNDQLVLEELRARSSGGTVVAKALANRTGKQFTVSGDGTFDKFPVISDDQLKAQISGRFQLAGDATDELIFIRELSVPELHVELPDVKNKDLQDLDRPDDIVLVRKGEPLFKRSTPGPAPVEQKATGTTVAAQTNEPVDRAGLRYTVIVNAPRNIWVKGADVNAEIGLSEGFRVELADRALLFGEVRFHRGRVDVLGRRFDVLKDSQVRFAGPAMLPYINVTAEHQNEREQVSVYTTVRGQGTDVTLRVTSQPALSESEIYSLLATGRRTLRRGSGSSMTGSEAATVATAWGASQLKRVISSKLPLDVVSFEAGSEGLTDASGEAGTYFTDDLYLGYKFRLGAKPERGESRHNVRLEYQLTPRWSFETQYGFDARNGGADMVWSRDY